MSSVVCGPVRWWKFESALAAMGSDLVDREDGRAVVWESDQCAYDDDDQLQARGFNAGRFTGYVYL